MARPYHCDREIFRGTGWRAGGNEVSSGNGPWARPLKRRIEGRRASMRHLGSSGSKNSSSARRRPVTGASNPRAVLRNVLLTEATPITEGSANRRIKTRCSSAPTNFNPIEGLSSGNSEAIKCPACSGANELVSVRARLSPGVPSAPAGWAKRLRKYGCRHGSLELPDKHHSVRRGMRSFDFAQDDNVLGDTFSANTSFAATTVLL